MKTRHWLVCLLGATSMLGCATSATEAAESLCDPTCRQNAVGFAMGTDHEVLTALGTSASRDAAQMLMESPTPAQQEAIADILLTVHKRSREITEQILAEEHALRSGTLEPSVVAEQYAEINRLRSQLIQSNATAIDELKKIDSAAKGSGGSSAQPRMMGGLPMMNVRWCIDFCAGQADVLCDGGADLACWRKRFLRCAQLCY